MSGVNGSGHDSALTMEPEGGVSPSVDDEAIRDLQIEQLFDDEVDVERCTTEEGGKQCLLVANHDADINATPHLFELPEPVDPDTDEDDDDEGFSASDLTEDQIKNGLANLSGGVATSQDIENAARAEEGLPPKGQSELPLDFGPFNADAALKAIFEKNAEIKSLQADYDEKKEWASDAKKELDKANRALVAIIDSLKNRRQQALNPSQPYLREVTDAAPASSACPWELAHPGQKCPICTAAAEKKLVPAVESEVHPEHEGHAAIAEAARVQNVLIPLQKKLVTVNLFVTIDDLQPLASEDLSALITYADEPSVMPPQLFTRTCVAAEHGTLVQICGRCERPLLSVTDESISPSAVVGWYPTGARVGLQCGVVTEAGEPATPAAQAETEPTRTIKSRGSRKTARKEPEKERARQADAGRRASDKQPKTPKAKKSAKRGKAKR